MYGAVKRSRRLVSFGVNFGPLVSLPLWLNLTVSLITIILVVLVYSWPYAGAWFWLTLGGLVALSLVW